MAMMQGFTAPVTAATPPKAKDQIPCAFTAQGVHGLPTADLVVHAHGHAGEDLDHAQHQRADEYGQRIIQRGEQAGQSHGGAGDHFGELGDQISKEAAGDGAEEEGGHTAVFEEVEELGVFAPQVFLFHHKPAAQHHQKPVAHVRHHHAVEEDEEGGHQGVGVHAAVGRQGIHVGYGVQGADHGAALELDRNLGIFLRGGIRQLIGAAEAVQQLRQGLFLLGRGPAFQEGRSFRCP